MEFESCLGSVFSYLQSINVDRLLVVRLDQWTAARITIAILFTLAFYGFCYLVHLVLDLLFQESDTEPVSCGEPTTLVLHTAGLWSRNSFLVEKKSEEVLELVLTHECMTPQKS
ncbi:hypothetical protein K435DRAFT_772285 [Dendrothele bispora CBS 962.96]|uniref:Uncharacterized protein n=1 Tax=Dendrothele bispora (strain CBS 962.96) TaxID=1314807 RepID=A0A4S8MX37_DENBC|nr:hypothetical protein K435DRAFT_772285 [Dendrothele bispora CBS 962.96]